MELWVRHGVAQALDWDVRVEVDGMKSWREAIADPAIISSILWPTGARFRPSGPQYISRRHPHEIDYQNDPARNVDYREGCRRLAARLQSRLAGARVLVYAPMRGAYPIWQVTSQFLRDLDVHTYYPVTSSFVRYPKQFGLRSHKGKGAGGRFTNLLELARLRALLSGFDVLLYVDEIISGGMMWGHTRELVQLGVDRQIKVVVAGLADSHGARSASNRGRLQQLVADGRLYGFVWEGCECSITEDQKFLLGVHYVDYGLGPHVVPMLDEDLEFYEERRLFFADALEA